MFNNPMLMLGQAPAAEIAYTDFASDGGGYAGSFTFSGMNFGAPDAGRILFLDLGWDSAGSSYDAPISVTAGGVTLDNLVTSIVGDNAVGVWAGEVPSGVSGDVVVDFGAGQAWAIGATLRRGIGMDISAAYDTAAANSATDTVSGTIDVEQGGVLIATSYQTASNLSDPVNAVWTGVDEDVDEGSVGNIARRMSGGVLEVAADQTGRSIQVETAGSSSYTSVLAAVSLSLA